MFKKLTALLLALLLPSAALAEVYEGTTAALSTVPVLSEISGTATAITAGAGDRVEAGDALLALKGESVFAAQDGSISLINVEAGEDADGTVLELMPLERYQIYCTVDKAYQSAATTLVHSGETVYIRCTSDGTHRAIGVVTLIDGEEFRVLTLGGELYIGETVYLYRDSDFTTDLRVGIGTVVANDTQGYAGSGAVTRLNVREGDEVERGQLLYELNGGAVEAPVSGILTSVSVQPGEAVEKDQQVAEIVADGMVCVEIQMEESEAARVSPGQVAELTLPGDDETVLTGTVIDTAWVTEDGRFTVRIQPEDGTLLPLGLTVEVRL